MPNDAKEILGKVLPKEQENFTREEVLDLMVAIFEGFSEGTIKALDRINTKGRGRNGE